MRYCVHSRLEEPREFSRQRGGTQMTTGIQELKQAARMQEWSARIIECRSSGKNVRAWCKEQGIASQTYYRWEKRFIAEATQRLSHTFFFTY